MPLEDSNHKGNVAEAKIAAAAIELGIGVLSPMTEHGRYDLVFDLGAELLRVQCKWANFRKGVVQVVLGGSYLSPHGYVRSTYSADEIDAVAAYCGDLDRSFLLPVELVAGRSSIHLRVEPALNAQRAGLSWASEYDLGAVAQLGRALPWHGRGRGFESHQLHPPDESNAGQVGAHEFRNHFGWYMQRAAAGEEILITRRGRPHARLGPPNPQLVSPTSRPQIDTG